MNRIPPEVKKALCWVYVIALFCLICVPFARHAPVAIPSHVSAGHVG